MSENDFPPPEKGRSYQSIKQMIEAFVGGREGLSVSQITDNVNSALEDSLLKWEEVQRIIEEVDNDVENNAIFPNVPVVEKQDRLAKVKDAIKY